MTTTPDMIQCPVCEVWFNNTDNSFLCPNGHEPAAERRGTPTDAGPELPERPRNWDRIVERADWALSAFQVVVAVCALITGDYDLALRSFGWAALLSLYALYFRDRARLRDHMFTTRVYYQGRIVAEHRLDYDGHTSGFTRGPAHIVDLNRDGDNQ